MPYEGMWLVDLTRIRPTKQRIPEGARIVYSPNGMFSDVRRDQINNDNQVNNDNQMVVTNIDCRGSTVISPLSALILVLGACAFLVVG